MEETSQGASRTFKREKYMKGVQNSWENAENLNDFIASVLSALVSALTGAIPLFWGRAFENNYIKPDMAEDEDLELIDKLTSHWGEMAVARETLKKSDV